ncbi:MECHANOSENSITIVE ION CHANNEL PROTEIN [Salix koriyanagi]|uniref:MECHANOSENSITIVE ION CHANNEL PROTEIN n=1 Tax=Salix koriyanagi TaxID=2511006 RepID=A0A9Q0V068_9ROSI|nr:MECHANOSENSITIVE ION CHANNEL PROTEIN [Salix koriyanagi]
MDKLKGDRGSSHERHLPSFPESSPTKPSYRETRVSFEPSLSGGSVNGVPESVRRQCKEDGSLNRHQRKQEREEVLKCSSNASFPRQANPLSRLKTKSRLLYDPSPEELERMSGRVPKSGTMRSRILSRVFDDEDDEDTLEDVDLPDEYKKDKLSTLTVLQWLSLVVILAALVCSLSILDLKKVNILNLKLRKWEVLLLVLICGRIQESLFNQFVIEALSGPPLIEIQKAEDDADRIATEVLKLQNAGATIPVELKESVFPPAKSGRLNPDRQCEKTFTTKKAGTKLLSGLFFPTGGLDYAPFIFHSPIKRLESAIGYIYLRDLMRFLEEDQASKTMSFFEEASETNENRERRALALTLNDTKTASEQAPSDDKRDSGGDEHSTNLFPRAHDYRESPRIPTVFLQPNQSEEVVDLNKLMVAVWMRHRMNHQDMAEKNKRRALLIEEMVIIFSEIDIQYRLFPIDINIRAMPPLDKNYCPP